MSGNPTSHRFSALARLQQMLLLSSWLAAGGWWALWHEVSLSWALAGVLFFLLGFAALLGLQFALMRALNRADAAPALSRIASWRAWWVEVRMAVNVFAWRQPFRWRALPDAAVPAAPGCRAVVLVHGFVCNRGLWLPWMRTCRQRGIPYTSVNLEPVFGSIDDYAPLIDDAVRRAQALTGLPPLLVCHSMGGLAARAWLAITPQAAERVSAVVTIGTPHHGTWIARFSRTINGRQMRVGGDWLQALAAREAGRGRPPFICWYSNADNIVFPTSTAMLEEADNRLLPGVPHVAMAFDAAVMDSTLALVASRPQWPAA